MFSLSVLILPLLLLLACLFVGTSNADNADLVRRLSIQNRWLQRRDDRWFGAPPPALGDQSCSEREPDEYFAQKLDHNNETDTNTYWQRYQANLRYRNSSDPWPIVFLMIGGEAQLHDKWVCDERVTIMRLAKEHGAVAVQLEHRFFGRNASSGLGDLSAANLQRLLTLDQALADIAAFVPFFNQQYGLQNARWVAFGGSYPGSMAAWLRVKYPELTVGNVASSAPIWPKVDFWEYSSTMEGAIKDTDEQCLDNVKKAFAQLADMLHNDQGKETLSKLYTAKPELGQLTPIDLTNFLSVVFGTWQEIIQYSFDQPKIAKDNVTRACELMAEAGTYFQKGLADVFWTVACPEDVSLENCQKSQQYDFRYDHTIAPLLNKSLEADMAESRAWMWMTCNEFGWYQTTDKENSIFGDIISLNFYYQQCADLFETPVGAKYVEARVQQSQKKLGNGCTFEASNVIMPNGRFDPWSALGIREGGGDGDDCRTPKQRQTDLDNHLLAPWTPAAAHCADMYPAYEGEPAGLELTREKVRVEVKYFLDSALARMQQQNGASSRTTSLVPVVIPMALAASFAALLL